MKIFIFEAPVLPLGLYFTFQMREVREKKLLKLLFDLNILKDLL